jgi:hypothetical protein
LAGFFKCQHLSVFDSFIAVKALANNDAIFHDNSANERIWSYLTLTFSGKCKRGIKKIEIAISVNSYFTRFHYEFSWHDYLNCTSLRTLETINISRIDWRLGSWLRPCSCRQSIQNLCQHFESPKTSCAREPANNLPLSID